MARVRACESIAARFWKNVCVKGHPSPVKGGCWLWTGGIVDGYGYLSGVGYAHRVAYRLLVGPIPDGLCVCHTCDNRRCVKPGHLFLGTNADNVADKVRKNRQHKPKGLLNGRALLDEETVKAIRQRYIPHHIVHGCEAMAREYGVCFSAIHRVIKHRSWRHILE